MAAVALIGLLVFAVVGMSTGSSRPSGFVPTSSAQTRSSSSRTEFTSTSYGRPSVQTSESNPATTPTASTEVPVPQQEDPVTTGSSTTNPYVTTTTQNGGAV